MTCTHAAVGFASLAQPVEGSWPMHDASGALVFPERTIVLGRVFKRSDRFTLPYPGVVAQYREDVDRNAMHLLVHRSGKWSIDHVDAANPERGLVFEHAVKDVAQTWWGASLFATGAVAAVAFVAFLFTRD